MELGDLLSQVLAQFGPFGWVIAGIMLYLQITYVRQRTNAIEAAADAKQKEAYTRLVDQQREDNRTQVQLIEQMRKEMVQQQERLQVLSEQNNRLTGKLTSAEKKLAEQSVVIETLESKLTSMGAIIRDLETQKDSNQHELEAERGKLRDLEIKYRSSEMKVQELERKVLFLEGERATLFKLFEMFKPREREDDGRVRIGSGHFGGGGAGSANRERAAGAQVGGGEREPVSGGHDGTDQAAAERRGQPGGADAQQGG